ncbi:DNA polymerase III subunit epsilon [Boudabousia tangfeifanii]|uniref:DNA polymerase III subunit epsilon n=1 Tax=Boudabousia tangfeifanii TaxID=1912795 RepID=A0A1D9MIM8_9ACTO|nr:exonuclease domain-containing protein [Boudabousia tangfeifanii]AOZ72157.1 DNA polymerase III subunit epsilon [Boudabousia tangfeifanii]
MQAFVSLDFETANEHRGSACSVALIKFDEEGNEVARFSTLLRPHESIGYFSPINVWVHGISEEDVVGAPSWAEIYDQVIDFIGDLPLVAHNMAFDGYVLTDLDALYGKEPLTNRRYCTVRLARRLLPDACDHRLPTIFSSYFPGESFSHHEAAADAWACARIFAQMQNEHGIDKINDLCPPTGPGAKQQKRVAGSRRWISNDSGAIGQNGTQKVELSELIEKFAGTQSLQGQRVAFTGTLETAPRETMQKLVEHYGGIAEKSTTKKTTILVVGISDPTRWAQGASASRKLEKATKLREAGSPITVMSEKDFLHYLHDGQH